MRLALSKSIPVLILYLLILFFTFGTILLYWSFRTNKSKVNPKLKIKVWKAVSDGTHNSNTDMIYWNEKFYLIHATSPYHFGTRECKLVLRCSEDAKYWLKIRTFHVENEDIRDPKLAIINNQMFLYALKNIKFNPEPYATIRTSSKNGLNWAKWGEFIDLDGWLFWRPKTYDGSTWYVPAYWWEHGKSKLLKSIDGIHWKDAGIIYKGLKNDETDIEFLPDGQMISTARLEGSGNFFGDERGCTLISIAKEPYSNWKQKISYVTRLDGPVLFSYNKNVYAVGRYQPKMGFLTKQGSIFSRKRTSIFLVEENKLTWLSDLPSAGDTSYGGVVIKNDYLYICYYTNNIQKDYPWLLGMISPSDILMVKIKLSNLEKITPI
jgi:hypothetical protein